MSEEQRDICKKYRSVYIMSEDIEVVGVALDTLNKEPIYGVRIMPTHKTTGWYIWGGPHSDDPNFYQPIHLSHLKQICPIVLKYLSLEPGFKFIINRTGYEDVWQETQSGNKATNAGEMPA